VRYFVGDGSGGWPAERGGVKFDRILVTAGTPTVPQPLLGQLAEGGIMVVPVGEKDTQMLVRVERKGEEVRETELMGCRFVPLVGKWGWDLEDYEKRRGEE
jgi:protein-L-isoaspartate(D-aspartate) O-methyltransferase